MTNRLHRLYAVSGKMRRLKRMFLFHVFRGFESVRRSSTGSDGIPRVLSTMAHLLSLPGNESFQQVPGSILHVVPVTVVLWLNQTLGSFLLLRCCAACWKKLLWEVTLILSLEILRQTLPLATDTPFSPLGPPLHPLSLLSLIEWSLCTLNDEPYAPLISLDLSRTFDTVRHSYRSEKLPLLPWTDVLYNWILSLTPQSPQLCTRFYDRVSALCKINTSIRQGIF